MRLRALTRLGAAVFVVSGAASAMFLLGRPDDRSARAERVYTRECAYCHDVEGNIGVPLEPRILRGYGSARRLYEYVRLAMPYDRPRTLSDEDIWLSVVHLLRSRGLVPDVGRMDREDATELVFEARE